MKRFFNLIIILILISGISACKSQKKAGTPAFTGDNSMTSLDWNGTYHGILPCADCEGIKTELVIKADLTYILRTQYLGKDENVFESKGEFSWNDRGSKIQLKNENQQMYLVGENRLFHLDQTGNRISGELVNLYVLEKDFVELTGKNWKLIALNKEPIKSDFKEPFIILDANENNVSGNTGCNNFFGTYELTGENGLKFSPLGMTKMACIGDNPEQKFIDALENTAIYSLSENELILKDENENNLATFRADYFLK